jgi:CDP-6-deoxy-D-xylo-4-hexulose-3-dehydrase
LSNKLLHICKKKKICLIEDACESHGATFKNRKVGTFGLMSNFSFYYAHHMSTIEGGMVCTNSSKIYQMLRSIRSHGLLRESNDENYKKNIQKKFKDLNKEFIFLYPGYNFRSTEINAVLGISQLKRLDQNIKKRNNNCKFFLKLLRQDIFFTDFNVSGMSNYAFNLILRKKNKNLLLSIIKSLNKNHIEYRLGSAGGGNQLRQPFLKSYIKKISMNQFKNVEHVHFFGMYIGN